MVTNKKMPGTRKLLNIELRKSDSGICITLPVGSDMSIAPPDIAVNALNSSSTCANMRRACFIHPKYCKMHAVNDDCGQQIE